MRTAAWTDYFCGQFLCELTCLACNNKSVSFNNFTDISLSFSGNAYSAVGRRRHDQRVP